MITSSCYGPLEPVVLSFLNVSYDSCRFEFLEPRVHQQVRQVEARRFNPGPHPSCLTRVMAMRESLGLLMREGNKPVGYVVGMDLASYNSVCGFKPEPDDSRFFQVYDLASPVQPADPEAPLFVCDALMTKLESVLCVPYQQVRHGPVRVYDGVGITLPVCPSNAGLMQMLSDAGYSRMALEHHKAGPAFQFQMLLDSDDDEDECYEACPQDMDDDTPSE